VTRAPAGRLTMRAEDLREPVLERVVAALAARVDLPLDRLSDAQLASSVLIRGARAATTRSRTGSRRSSARIVRRPADALLTRPPGGCPA